VTSPIRFHFDFISPYAYLAWTQIHALAARHGRAVEPVPVLFAALLNHHGTKGPAEVPAKRSYIFKDVFRTASRFGVRVSMPPSHPFNPLVALRVASLPMADDVRRALVDALFAAVWGGGQGVTDPAEVARIAASIGLDGEAALRDASSDAGKARVKEQTDAALAAGVFGVPSVIVAGELFWGVDAFPNLERFLEGKDPLEGMGAAPWLDLPASADRLARPGKGT
jgi:2-hydroxychromene-2-carboxylate isomerase